MCAHIATVHLRITRVCCHTPVTQPAPYRLGDLAVGPSHVDDRKVEPARLEQLEQNATPSCQFNEPHLAENSTVQYNMSIVI